MNKKDSIYLRNKLLQKIKHTNRSVNKEGYVKLNCSNSLEHEMAKTKVTYLLKLRGYYVFTECEFSERVGIGDIIAIRKGRGYIIEILTSETDKRFNKKKSKYPKEFNLIKIHSKDILKREQLNLEEWGL